MIDIITALKTITQRSKKYVDDSLDSRIPACTTDDNDKILSVVDGVPTWITIINTEEVEY